MLPVTVRWEGAQLLWHSLAHVNRELCLGLLARRASRPLPRSYRASQFTPEEQTRFAPLAGRIFASLPRPADVHVRHFFPPRFERRPKGHLVLMQPWEYGYLPAAGFGRSRSRSPKSGATAGMSGTSTCEAASRRISCTSCPWEWTPRRSAPKRRPMSSPRSREPPDCEEKHRSAKDKEAIENAAPFVFLFVGGTLHRKGIDILLDAYVRAFSAFDDVVLVIKDTGTQTVYRDHNERERILNLASDPTRPSIVYLEDDLSAHQLAGVYTAADCLVQPYRGEGFCLPVLEAMACGLPVIVPEGGPTDDFVDESGGVADRRRSSRSGRAGSGNGSAWVRPGYLRWTQTSWRG